jgi:hypothetical protein
MNAPDSKRVVELRPRQPDLSDPPANDQIDEESGSSRDALPSQILTRANLLAEAGIPVDAIRRILDGQYDLWDDETVFWDQRFPGRGKEVMAFLRSAYDLTLDQESEPSVSELTYMVREAFPRPNPGPIVQMYQVELLTPEVLEERQGSYKWLGDALTPRGQAPVPPLDSVFPWGPAEAALRASYRFQFGTLRHILSAELRRQLWYSFTRTLRSVWSHMNGRTHSYIINPILVRDLWTRGNCLPVGFGSRFNHVSFAFVDVRQP